MACPAKQAKNGGPYNDRVKNRLDMNPLSRINHSVNSGKNTLWGRGRCSYSGRKDKNEN